MGLAQWFSKVFSGKTKQDSNQNWIYSPLVVTSNGYRVDEDGWVYPVDNIFSSRVIQRYPPALRVHAAVDNRNMRRTILLFCNTETY